MGDFFGFYRDYAQTGVHAASTAALTAFGLLMRYHEGFAVVAILAYLAPLAYRYRQYRKGDGVDELGELRESDEHDDSGDSVERDESDEHNESDERRVTAEEQRPTGGQTEDEGKREQTGSAHGDPAEWRESPVETTADLYDVVGVPAAEESVSAYAVGAGGLVLRRGPEQWEPVLEDGPGAAGNALRGVDATSDGRGVWLTGDGGSLGRLDAETGRHTDHTAPGGDTSNTTDIAVSGPDGAETLFVADGSGQVRRGQYDGETVRWSDPVKPGSGSSLSAVEAVDWGGDEDEGASRVYAVDTNGGVFRSSTGDEWESVGIDGASALTDVAVGDSDELFVTSDDGTVSRYDGAVWTPVETAESSLRGIAVGGDVGVAVGDDGTVLEAEGRHWTRRETFGAESLAASTVAVEHLFAVGGAGTILERER
ncbi:NHL repeat-containing protein [Halogranum rubrum]|nr:hypothetical protein [Halogranum salarium]